MKSESQFACLLIVERAGANGLDALTFAHRRWPDHKKLKEEGGAAQLCSGAGALLTALAEENLVEKIGEGRDARYVLTWQGRDFLANYVSDRQTKAEPPLPAPPAVDELGRSATLETQQENVRLHAEAEFLRGEVGRLRAELTNAQAAVGELRLALTQARNERLEKSIEAQVLKRLLQGVGPLQNGAQ